jgi:hypothetical protein
MTGVRVLRRSAEITEHWSLAQASSKEKNSMLNS